MGRFFSSPIVDDMSVLMSAQNGLFSDQRKGELKKWPH
jgi:hypothetical protein